MTKPPQFPLLDQCPELIIFSDGCLNLSASIFVSDMVLVRRCGTVISEMRKKNITLIVLTKMSAFKDADGMANSVDPDKTAPCKAVLSGSELFAQFY